MNLENLSRKFRDIIARRINWENVDVGFEFTLTVHEIMLGSVVTAETDAAREEAYLALQRSIDEYGGWHGNRRLGTVELQAGDYFVIKCVECGMKHRGIIEDGVMLGRVICPVREGLGLVVPPVLAVVG